MAHQTDATGTGTAAVYFLASDESGHRSNDGPNNMTYHLTAVLSGLLPTRGDITVCCSGSRRNNTLVMTISSSVQYSTKDSCLCKKYSCRIVKTEKKKQDKKITAPMLYFLPLVSAMLGARSRAITLYVCFFLLHRTFSYSGNTDGVRDLYYFHIFGYDSVCHRRASKAVVRSFNGLLDSSDSSGHTRLHA